MHRSPTGHSYAFSSRACGSPAGHYKPHDGIRCRVKIVLSSVRFYDVAVRNVSYLSLPLEKITIHKVTFSCVHQEKVTLHMNGENE